MNKFSIKEIGTQKLKIGNVTAPDDNWHHEMILNEPCVPKTVLVWVHLRWGTKYSSAREGGKGKGQVTDVVGNAGVITSAIATSYLDMPRLSLPPVQKRGKEHRHQRK